MKDCYLNLTTMVFEVYPNNRFKFYLYNRKQFVSINGYDTGFAEINYGVF